MSIEIKHTNDFEIQNSQISEKSDQQDNDMDKNKTEFQEVNEKLEVNDDVKQNNDNVENQTDNQDENQNNNQNEQTQANSDQKKEDTHSNKLQNTPSTDELKEDDQINKIQNDEHNLEDQSKTNETKKCSIFSSIFQKHDSIDMFKVNEDELNEDQKLFRKMLQNPSLQDIKFNLPQNKSMFFGYQLKPQLQEKDIKPKEEDDEDEDENKEGNKNSEIVEQEEEPKEIIMKYTYEKQTENIYLVEILKFRVSQNTIFENGSLSIEKTISDSVPSTYWLIYRNEIKQINYQGQLIKKISQIKPLGQQQRSISIQCLTRKGNQEPKLEIIKMMFNTQEEVQQFNNTIENIIQ